MELATWVAKLRKARENVWLVLSSIALASALLIAYSNHFHNSFHFDDAHTIENNAAIRDLRNVPLFFRDATTFSSLPSNQSYRPLVSTLLAFDYWVARGLNPFWFHVSIFVLFLFLVLLMQFVLLRLLDRQLVQTNGWLALIAAAWYALNPVNADTVNYVIASAEVIAALGVVGSFAIYFAFPKWRPYFIYVLPASMAILAKPPAAIFAILFAIFLLLFPEQRSVNRSVGRRALRWFAAVMPAFIVCGAISWFVQYMTPATWVAGAYSARNYLITQPYVMWLYFKTFLWPGGLSADYDLNPFATTDDPRFWIGFLFVTAILVTAGVTAVFSRTRLISFGLFWFVIALLPTSLFPLAEVMNDHRAGLAYIGLVTAFAAAVALLINRKPVYGRNIKATIICATIVFLATNVFLTRQRNKVWTNEESLWRDVAFKSPANPRGLMNYGTALMARGDLTSALSYFHRAQTLAPQYAVLLINLAVAEDATGQQAEAEQHFQEALRLAPVTPDSYVYYARWLVAHSRPNEAIPLARRAVELSPGDVTAGQLLATAQQRSPRETPEHYLDLSLQYYQANRFEQSILASRVALMLRPDYAEAWNNIGAAYNKLGRYDKAALACERALQFKPDFELARNNLKFAREMEWRGGR